MMYSFSVTQQLIVFLRSFALGLISGFSYSVIYFAAAFISTGEKMRRIISDTVFSVIMLLASFCFVLAYNLGSVRFHIILGVFFGVIIYKLTFGQVVDFVFLKIRNGIIKISNPIYLLFKKLFVIINEKICKKTYKKSSECIANKNKNVV